MKQDRGEAVRLYRKAAVLVPLAHVSGASGLTLTEAAHVAFLEPPVDPGLETQASYWVRRTERPRGPPPLVYDCYITLHRGCGSLGFSLAVFSCC